MKVPERTCVACRLKRPKAEMLRVGCTDGWTVTRGDVKLHGRGAYLCPNAECIDKARSRRAVERSLGRSVPDEAYDKAKELSGESV